ncbi:MAG: radical SAM protein [Desulfobacterales bacterium]|nr:MAG: radical SAM protein [Desulfobacterales bacterium]
MRFNNFWCYRRILFSKGFAAAVRASRKNLRAFERDRPPVAGPYMAELDVTYQCNCRCQMCQRWRDPRQNELSLAEYRTLAARFDDLRVHQISIAGGEPLMRGDVFAVIQAFADRGMSVNLCTNGMLLEKYQREIRSSGATCVTVSLDGATAECHDGIRGMPGSYRQIMRGIRAFLDRRVKTMPILRVRMTISNRNIREIRAFCRKWKNVADDILLQPVHHCGAAYYTGMDDAFRHLDPATITAQISPTALAQDGYMGRLVQSLAESGSFPHTPCYAGLLMTRIDPWGHVYPCLEQHVCVGSVRANDFAAIWNSARFNRERRRLAANRPCRCWYNNTALIGHFGQLLANTNPQRLWTRFRNQVGQRFQSVFPYKLL